MGWDKLRRRVSFAGLQQGAPRRDVERTDSATKTLAARESGKVIVATKASATQTFTLPAATVEGCEVTVVVGNGAAAGEVLIDPAGTDAIVCNANSGASPAVEVRPAGGTGIKNTAATNVDGDMITLVADGVATWHAISQRGIWASQ